MRASIFQRRCMRQLKQLFRVKLAIWLVSRPCPRCRGAGIDPVQLIDSTDEDPVLDPCKRCGTTGRICRFCRETCRMPGWGSWERNKYPGRARTGGPPSFERRCMDTKATRLLIDVSDTAKKLGFHEPFYVT